MYDIVIKNTNIIDGLKSKKYVADVGIFKGKIKYIGSIKITKARKLINGNGLYLCPGFIDLNNHSDTYLSLFNNSLESLLQQGITTILGGNCGSSLAPLTSGDMIKSVQKWADISEINLNWLSFEEFLNEIEKRKISVNFGSLVGHSTLRRGILGEEFRLLKKKELEIIKDLLKKALKQGAFGLSTGLAYSHAKVASKKELVELAKVVALKKGIYASHIRGEAEELLPAIQETIDIAKESGVSVEISHLKAMGKRFWPNMKKALSLIEKAGINFDVYPYTVTGSVLYILLPDWVAKGGKEMMLKRLKNNKQRIIKEMQEKKDYEYDKIIISISPTDKTFIGKKITDIAKAQGVSVEQAIINMLIASQGRIITFLDTLDEYNVEMAMSHDLSFISSNGAGYDIDHYKKKGELVHPRCFGAFPRFLGKYVRNEQLLDWEDAIYKISGGPAKKMGLKDRGVIKKGNWADLVLINPRSVIDNATFVNPYQYPSGIDYVFVNGQIAVEKGSFTGIKAGRVLRKS